MLHTHGNITLIFPGLPNVGPNTVFGVSFIKLNLNEGMCVYEMTLRGIGVMLFSVV